jgi:hypothetical protein
VATGFLLVIIFKIFANFLLTREKCHFGCNRAAAAIKPPINSLAARMPKITFSQYLSLVKNDLHCAMLEKAGWYSWR